MVSGEICELPGCRNPRKVKPVQKATVLVPLRMAVHTALVLCPLPSRWLGTLLSLANGDLPASFRYLISGACLQHKIPLVGVTVTFSPSFSSLTGLW